MGYVRLCTAMYGHAPLCRAMHIAMYGYARPCTAMYSYVRRWRVMNGYARLCHEVYVRLCTAMYGYARPCTTMKGPYAELCTAMQGYARLCRVMYGYVRLCRLPFFIATCVSNSLIIPLLRFLSHYSATCLPLLCISSAQMSITRT